MMVVTQLIYFAMDYLRFSIQFFAFPVACLLSSKSKQGKP